MHWEDERYVRLYTRDSPDWLCMSFLAQGLLCLLLRKVDRAGILPLGRAGRKGVAIAIGHGHQWSMIEPALEELLADGCVQIADDRLVIPNFIEAQEAEASDRARARKHRERVRDLTRAGSATGKGSPQPEAAPESRAVTDRHANRESRDGTVTPRDAPVTGCNASVTPNQAVPSKPPEPTTPTGGGAREDDGGREGTRIEAPAQPSPLEPQWPLTERFRRIATDGLGGQQRGGKGLRPLDADHDGFESLLARAPGGVQGAADAMLQVARDYGESVGSLAFFWGPLRRYVDGTTAKRTASGAPRRTMAPVSNWDDPTKARETL